MTAEEKSRSSWLWTVLKLLLIVLAGWIVYGQVSWLDSVEVDGGVYRGQILEGVEPGAKELVIREVKSQSDLTLTEWVPGSKTIGLRTTFSRLDPTHYLLGMLLIFGMYALGILRWKLLLAAQGIRTTYFRAFRLTFIGFFSNNFMPGMTGGDVVKAVIIARDTPGRRSEAVSTVIVDRVIGLAVLALLSAMAILMNFSRFREQGYIVFAVLGACLVLFVCFFSKRVRKAIHLDRFLKMLPGSGILMKLDRAFHLYRSHPGTLAWAFGISVVSHFCNIGSVYVFGQDMGVPADLTTYFATVPLILIAAAVPVFPAGWGIREVLFIKVFIEVGIPENNSNLLFLLSVLFGVSILFWSLLGGVFLLLERRRHSGEDEPAAPILPPQD